ncbi:MAG TPA: 3-deoxy-7-phosphoheptulonate synthase [Firmicutes bacterium]|nr:3-deoxy-7-phosphoheptulonate synthase [Bacillota bacterium]
MVIVMSPQAGPVELGQVQERLQELGFGLHVSKGVERTIIGAIGEKTPELIHAIEALAGVEKVVPILKPFKLASKEFSAHTEVKVGHVTFGGEQIVVVAGPCAVEDEEQLLTTARRIKEAGAQILRGGAYKPRTSPYSFQGLEEEGLKLLQAAGAETGLPVVTEVVNPKDVELVAKYADMFQIGARNMQNFTLLREVGQSKKPVILKRGLAATVEEWLMAAEYIMKEGNYQVVLCERGIRTFETATRNTMDLSAIPLIKELSHLPVIADPSHATGRKSLILPMSKAAVAAGADGLMVEVHPRPEQALSDGPQSLNLNEFGALLDGVQPLIKVMGRKV